MRRYIVVITYFYFKLAFFAILCCKPLPACSQSRKPGSIEYLKFCNGIKNITLGADITTLPVHRLAYLDGDNKPDADSCLKYVYEDDNMLAIGDSLKLDLIGIRTYKGKIVNIYLFFKRVIAYKILDDFIKSYGQFTERPDNYLDIYNWNSRRTSLSLQFEHKVELGVAVFTCNELESKIEAAKQNSLVQENYQTLSQPGFIF